MNNEERELTYDFYAQSLKSEISAAAVLNPEQQFIVFDLIDKVLGGSTNE